MNKIVRLKEEYAFQLPIQLHYGEVVETNTNSNGEKEIRLKTDLRYAHDSFMWILEEYYEYLN